MNSETKRLSTVKKSYPAVDCFKFICCILIIAIHAKPFEQSYWLDAGVGLVTRFAVPYFFVATGFFFFKSVAGQESGRKRLLKYELRMLRFYTVWFIIHTAQNMLRGYIYSPMYYIRHFFWPANGSILRFIPATMFAVAIVYSLQKIMSARSVFAISALIWIIGYSMSTVAPLFGADSAYAGVIAFVRKTIGFQNGLFFGFPYIALSRLITEQNISNSRVHYISGIIACFCCLAAESILVVTRLHPEWTFLWLSALPMTWFAFMLTLSVDINDKPLFSILRKTSTLVYVVHPVIIPILQSCFAAIGFTDFMNLGLFFLTCVLSLSLSAAILKLSEKRQSAFLKYFM